MTLDDRPKLAEMLVVLAETFNEPVSDLRAEGYYEALKDLPFEVVEQAGLMALRTSKFFPRPAELRELATGKTEDAAALGWAELLREVRRVGYLGTPKLSEDTFETMRNLWGSWAQLCETLPADGPELIGWMKQFQTAYVAGVRTRSDQHYLGRGEAKALYDALMSENAKRIGS